MFSLKTSAAVAAFLIISTSAKDYYIDPNGVPISTRRSWCTSQIAACPLLCMQNKDNGTSVINNDCDAETLWFECVCSNGLSPNMSEYSETLPYFMCVEYGKQCIAGCALANTQCQSDCRTNNLCGAQNPQKYNITTTPAATPSPTAGSSDGVVHNGFDTQTTSASAKSGSGSSGANMALDLGRSYGLAVVLTGFFAGFALIL